MILQQAWARVLQWSSLWSSHVLSADTKAVVCPPVGGVSANYMLTWRGWTRNVTGTEAGQLTISSPWFYEFPICQSNWCMAPHRLSLSLSRNVYFQKIILIPGSNICHLLAWVLASVTYVTFEHSLLQLKCMLSHWWVEVFTSVVLTRTLASPHVNKHVCQSCWKQMWF